MLWLVLWGLHYVSKYSLYRPLFRSLSAWRMEQRWLLFLFRFDVGLMTRRGCFLFSFPLPLFVFVFCPLPPFQMW